MKRNNQGKFHLIALLFSICLFYIAFNSYDIIYHHVIGLNSNIVVNTQAIGSKFLRNIVFAFNLSVVPIVSVFLSKLYSELKLKRIVIFSCTLLFAEVLGLFMRLLYLQNQVSDITAINSATIESVKAEESMLVGGILAVVLIVVFNRVQRK